MDEVICRVPRCGHRQNVDWDGHYAHFECGLCQVYQIHCRCGAWKQKSSSANMSDFRRNFRRRHKKDNICKWCMQDIESSREPAGDGLSNSIEPNSGNNGPVSGEPASEADRAEGPASSGPDEAGELDASSGNNNAEF